MKATLQEFIDRIALARTSARALRIRGGGSKDFYGNPLGDFDTLDTRAYCGITDYEPSELVVTVRAGTPLAELEAALAEKNQFLAFEPPHYNPDTTVGGIVAAGLAGASRATVGNVRDFVLGVQMVNGAGEVLQFGGTVMKNVAGYDVSRVLAGSMGTLGLLTEVSLKVLPIPVADASLQCKLSQISALALMNRWRGQPLPINSTAWLQDDTDGSAQEHLFVRLRGAKAAVESGISRILADVTAAGGTGTVMNAAQSAADWRKSNNHQLPYFQAPPPLDERESMCLWRLSIPATTPELDLPHPQYIEWQGAQRWLWAKASEGNALRAVAQAAGGHAVLFKTSPAHGATDKSAGVFQPLSPVLAKINQDLRQQLDPHGVFNTGRI